MPALAWHQPSAISSFNFWDSILAFSLEVRFGMYCVLDTTSRAAEDIDDFSPLILLLQATVLREIFAAHLRRSCHLQLAANQIVRGTGVDRAVCLFALIGRHSGRLHQG